MPIAVAAGFPYSNGTGGAVTATPTLQAAGDLLLLTCRYDRGGGVVTGVSGVSGAGTTDWVQVTEDAGVQGTDFSGAHTAMWMGRVTAAGATTITVSYTGGTPGSGNVMVIELAGYAAWGVDVKGNSNSLGVALTTVTWPSLTATGKGPSEAYVGYAYDDAGVIQNTATAGFTAFGGTGAAQTEMVYNVSATAGPYAPTATCVSGHVLTVAAIVYGFTPIQAPVPFLPRNVLGRGVRNRGQIALFLQRIPEVAAPSGPAILVASTADTSLSSDAVSRVVAFPDGSRIAGETSLTSDALTRVEAQPRSTADTSASSDAVTRSAMLFARSAADTSTSTDAAARVSAQPRAAADTSASSDAATRLVSLVRSSADTSLSSDAATRIDAYARAVADTSTSSDSVSAKKGVGASTADTSASSDTAARTIALTRATADTSTSSDAAARVLLLPRPVADTSASSDAITRVARFPRSSADSSTSADAITRQLALPRAASDTSLSSDATTRGALHFQRASADTSLSTDQVVHGTAPPPPPITLPSTGTILAYRSSTSVRAYTGAAAIVASTGAAAIVAYTSTATLGPRYG